MKKDFQHVRWTKISIPNILRASIYDKKSSNTTRNGQMMQSNISYKNKHITDDKVMKG